MTDHCEWCPFLGCDSCAHKGGETVTAQQDSGYFGAGNGRIQAQVKTPAMAVTIPGRGRTVEEFDVTSVPSLTVPTSVYLYFDETDILIYVGVTSRGSQRQREHNGDKEWWPYVARQEVRHFPSRETALDEERRLIQKHLPPFNRHHNERHELTRVAYLELRAIRHGSTTADERRSIRRGLPLTALSAPLAGHKATLCSDPADAAALVGELVVDPLSQALVSTPRRHRSGRVVEVRFVGGVLLIGVDGRFIPEEIHNARAKVGLIQNRKPAGFYLQRVMLNEPAGQLPPHALRNEGGE